MAIAFGLGVVGSIPFPILGQVWAYAFVAVAGLLAAWLVNERGRGLAGLLLGVAAVFAVYGGYEVVRKIQSCQATECSGIGSPNLTAAIVVGFGLIGLACAVAGWLAGRMTRAITSRFRAPG